MYTFARQQLSLCLMYALLLSSANGWTTNGFTRLGLGCQWLDFRELQRSVTPLTQQCTQNVWFCLTYVLSLSCIFSCLRCDCASLNFRRRLGYSCRFEDGATHAHWHKNIIPEAGATHAQWPRPWAPPTAGANLSDLVDPHRGLVRPHVWAMQIHGL